ncbi:O-antigen ligase family protein [Candidatus Pelagibacter sp.]|jgi:O-antigen ligase|nr:O-antigen ligase family protein [Candidatus Pelagibacter sp.]|tara:strand:- start:1658 stop:2950 length:1293 start_codon:yes stop_codon:yes gene_type:complete
MKNEILNFNKENFIDKISLIFISIFPVILLTGSAIVNTSIVLMNILFLIHIYKKKKFKVFNNDVFYLLFALWTFFIINTLLNDNISENYARAFGFIRFILLVFLISYFFSYKDFLYKKAIINVWTLIFIIVSLDLVFEIFFGHNTLGFSSSYRGRLSGFMGDELKIGHWYFCFSLIILTNFIKKNKRFCLLLLISIIISFFIGERANFIRLFLALFILVIFTQLFSFKKIAILTFSFFVIVFYLTTDSAEKIVGNTLSPQVITYKNKFIDNIKASLTFETIDELNEKNPYTPMYFNAYYIYKDNKLLGVGMGSYMEKSHEKLRKNRKTRAINGNLIVANTHPHQHHFEILATLGLPGYIFIFSFLLYYFYKSLRFYKKNKEPINLTSFIFLFVLIIPLLPTGSFFTTYGASIFWLNFSLMNLGNFKNINH